MPSPEKGRGNENSAKGKKGGKKGKASHTGKGYGEQAAQKPSYFEGECRNCVKYRHKAADCWHKHPKLSGKAKGKRNPKYQK